ncbi:fasciclin domain-containing protein [Sphingomonas koreensis]|nr:fasciclin domain-containing protein [Sphingomonas koreensis]
MSFAKSPLIALVAAVALAGCATGPDGGPVAGDDAGASRPVKAAAGDPSIGGAMMYADRTIVANASEAPNLTTLVKAIQASDLAATLSGPGPYTVFAPTNAAFDRLAPGTVETLLKPENKASLIKLLSYHVVAGVMSGAQLRARIAAGGGTTTLTTLEGDTLTATLTGAAVTLTDVNGNKSYVETADVRQSNGVVHVVNGVLIPRLA